MSFENLFFSIINPWIYQWINQCPWSPQANVALQTPVCYWLSLIAPWHYAAINLLIDPLSSCA